MVAFKTACESRKEIPFRPFPSLWPSKEGNPRESEGTEESRGIPSEKGGTEKDTFSFPW